MFVVLLLFDSFVFIATAIPVDCVSGSGYVQLVY
jgi:hypothetical protein